MAVAQITPNTPAVNTISRDQSGFAGLTANDFMKLLITELQNQDPTKPMDNEALLSQLSTMRNLQANIELSDTLKSLTNNQQLSTAAAFIGKAVSGRTDSQQDVYGIVSAAFLRDGKAYVNVGDASVPLANVTEVATL